MKSSHTDLREPLLVRLATYPISLQSLTILVFFVLYSLVAVLLFHYQINPSLDGRSDAHITADSKTYMDFADCLSSGCRDPFVIASLAKFPNTLWAPVVLALLLKSTYALAALNIGVFFLSIWLLKSSFPGLRAAHLTLFLIINATTLISLLSVNKEIIDLLVISLFCYSRARGRTLLLVACLLIALINRYEVCAMLLLYMFILSKFNPLRKRRMWTLAGIIFGLSILLPILAAQALSSRFEEVQDIGRDGLLVILDNFEMHFLFIVAFVPKLIEVMFGDILSLPSRWSSFSIQEAANTYIVFFNNMANVLVIVILLCKRTLKLRSDAVYLAAACAIVVSTSLVNQPRYFYLCFALLCVQASYPREQTANLVDAC